MNFCHLHLHTQYSQLDGYGTAKQYCAEANRIGQKYLASTDHGNVDGLIRFQKACKETSITPLLGVELYMVPHISIKEPKENRYHITALITNKTGLTNIFKMLTIANLEGFYRRPRIDPTTLLRHTDGLIFMSACTSSFINMPGGVDLLLKLNELTNTYLEIMPHNYNMQKQLNIKKTEISNKYSIPLVATNDCHYPLVNNARTQEVLLAIQRKAKWSDPNRWKFDIDGLYLRTREEMAAAFGFQGCVLPSIYEPALDRTIEVAELCNGYHIEQIPVLLPKVPEFENVDETELMKEIIEQGFQERLINKGRIAKSQIPEYKARIEEEFNLICDLGFQRYFLIVWELISWCRKNEIMVGPGRGSVGGCLIAYLMRITDVDPIKYNLVFARFISPARIDLPDIDMDFEDIKRDRIRKHLQELYGEYNVAGLSTFMTMKGRGAIRDVARVFDVPAVDTDRCAKAIVVRSGGDFRSDFCVEDACNTFEDAISFKAKYPDVVKFAIDLEGQVKGSGQHAAAMCISSEDLRLGKRCNYSMRNGNLVANWDKYDSEYMGIMKLDVLGLSALTILNHTRKLIKQSTGEDIEFDYLPLDDKKVFEEISKGNNVGAFQIGSLGLMKICREMGINEFEDIVSASAIFRPGTLRSGMTTEFILRKTGQKPVEYIHPKLENITKDTYGIILYQEQVMWFMYELGGLPWKTCDQIRKVISKSQGDELFRSFKEVFINGCAERKTLSESEAGHVWDQLSSFGSYGFNRSHSVEYSLITYWDMYCKVHYPKEFMCALLTYGRGDKKSEYIDEARRLELIVELPKVGKSHPEYWLPSKDSNKIYAPFIEIKGVGKVQAKKIADGKKPAEKMHKGFFGAKETEDNNTLANKSITEILNKICAFTEEDLTEEQMKKAEQYFNFNISKNRMGKYAKLFERINHFGLIKNIADVDFTKPDKRYHYYFGQMTEIKFGYKQNTEKGKGLGGVYGNLKDETDFSMLVFEGSIYQKKKFDIEHCSGDWILTKASHPRSQSTLFCNEIWIGKELLECNLKDFDANLLTIIRDLSVVNCDACELRTECTKPVSPSTGRYNAMIVGEAPGKDEDKAGTGFVGKAGNQILWPEMKRLNLWPQMFHVTNVVKCWPSTSKTPSKKHISACSFFLEEEIKYLNPIIMLAFGNTSVKFFKDQESGIIALNGTTEWSEKYGCWICWCIHPASVLYSESNRITFQEGMANFATKLKYIGFKTPINTPIQNCPIGVRFGKDNNAYTECDSCKIWQQCAEHATNFDWMKI